MTDLALGHKTAEQDHRRMTLLATSVSYVLVILDTSIVNVALERMAISVMLSTVDRKYAGITSGISFATGQLGVSMGVAIFGAFLADAHRIADGARIAATISTASTALIVLIVWHLWRQRDRMRVNRISSERR